MIFNIIAVFTGGGIGALVRYLVSNFCTTFFHLPILGTLIVNLTGCFLIGCMFGLISDKIQVMQPVLRLFIMTGFLGGLTTFSTFCLESFELIKDEKIAAFLLYIVASCVLGLLLVFMGYMLVKHP